MPPCQGQPRLERQAIWWPFDQQKNLATAQNDIFNAGSVIYFRGFCVLMFALIGVHGRQAHRAGRLGTFGFAAAVLGTIFLGWGPVVRKLYRSVACRGPVSAGSQRRGQARWRLVTLLRVRV